MSLTLTGVGLNVPGNVPGGDTIIMPYFEHHPAWSSYDAESGFNYTRFQGSGRLGGGSAYQGSGSNADNGDSIGWYVSLSAGTWTISFVYALSTDRAIVNVKLDSTVIGSFDGYGTSDPNAIRQVTGVVVGTAANYLLSLTANGKHASSSDYVVAPGWIACIRTGA